MDVCQFELGTGKNTPSLQKNIRNLFFKTPSIPLSLSLSLSLSPSLSLRSFCEHRCFPSLSPNTPTSLHFLLFRVLDQSVLGTLRVTVWTGDSMARPLLRASPTAQPPPTPRDRPLSLRNLTTTAEPFRCSFCVTLYILV